MKYCSHCGNSILDEAVFCPKCGCAVEKAGKVDNSDSQNETLGLIAKIFMIISCVACGFFIIPLCWMIPMTISVCNSLKEHRPISLTMKVCTLIFVNTVGGILLLCMGDQD